MAQIIGKKKVVPHHNGRTLSFLLYQLLLYLMGGYMKGSLKRNAYTHIIQTCRSVAIKRVTGSCPVVQSISCPRNLDSYTDSVIVVVFCCC